MPHPSKLLFVYNADSGLFNTLADIGHKLFSPETYECRLCALSHGLLSERKTWRTFIEDLPVSSIFLHRDEFRALYPGVAAPLPAVFHLGPDGLEVCIPASELNACKTLDQLQSVILQRCLIDGERQRE